MTSHSIRKTDGLLPMNPEGVKVDDSQVQHGVMPITSCWTDPCIEQT
ncbi:TPA: hypothetical protein HA335_01940 [Methanocaldococcus jannaschii]|uniref:Uncharacterized protein n=1 Tax=Methanocaldococcus jannaschii TaxID=2190 RepID=A0A832WHR4_9EURY|nr:hypothetical protein [Methanocaldococcus jannaschii]